MNKWSALLGGALVTLIVISPLALIWSLNTLFGLGIGYTLKTWFAALLLSSIFWTPNRRKD